MNQTEKFCKLNGIEWHESKTKKEKCSCGEVTFLSNPADHTLGEVVRQGLFCTVCPKKDKCELECNEIKEK